MIIQAISLLDELDKEINIYAMRVKEWYGWHFPELQKIVLDNIQYSKVILKMGYRKNAHDLDFSDILEDTVEEEMKKAARELDFERAMELRDIIFEMQSE